MAHVIDQALPAIAALAGVALTFAGSAILERHKWRRIRQAEQEDRALRAIADLVQGASDLVRLLFQTSERAGRSVPLDYDRLWDEFNDALGRVRRSTVFAGLVAPLEVLPQLDRLSKAVHPCVPLMLEIQKIRNVDGLLPSQLKAELLENVHALQQTRNELTSAMRGRSLP